MGRDSHPERTVGMPHGDRVPSAERPRALTEFRLPLVRMHVVGCVDEEAREPGRISAQQTTRRWRAAGGGSDAS